MAEIRWGDWPAVRVIDGMTGGDRPGAWKAAYWHNFSILLKNRKKPAAL